MTDPSAKKCVTEECNEYGVWQSGRCPGCRRHLANIEARPLRWRIERQELIMKWNSRLTYAIEQKNVVHIRRKRHGS